jgi:hypothetical protein
MGHFVDPASGGSVRATDALEIKWGIHPAGQERPEWTADKRRSTLVLLVSGKFRVDLTVGSVTMDRQGDYIVWGPGIDHSWQAEQVLATSLYEHPSAGLHADASASVREHPARVGCSILCRPRCPSGVGGREAPAVGHEEGTVTITESDRISGHCTAGQPPNDALMFVKGVV